MCGIFFVKSKNIIDKLSFEKSLHAMDFRGPDDSSVLYIDDNKTGFGHLRLQIIGDQIDGSQPMVSHNDRYIIIFNGEIYNYKLLSKQFFAGANFKSDTRLLIELFTLLGDSFVDHLEGMFAFVIYDKVADSWFAYRDRFGIKPLFYYQDSNMTILSSEIISFKYFVDLEVDSDSLIEWKKFRRCCPNHTFYKNIFEVLPGYYKTERAHKAWYYLIPSDSDFCLETSLNEVITDHLCSDVDVTCLLSGGVDSSIIAKLTNLKYHYTVGLPEINEFDDVKEFCDYTNKFSYYIDLNSNDLFKIWREMSSRRLEPLSVPNEALIYHVCKSMPSNTKVVLSGEGADEIMFGYDRIFGYMNDQKNIDLSGFLNMYSYSSIQPTDRILDYINDLSFNKSPIEFCEDFFLFFHLPGLLRRVDFSMMLASKEGRVPFVDRRIIEPLYRKSYETKNVNGISKSLLKDILNNNGLNFVSKRNKIGFTTKSTSEDTNKYYEDFQKIMLKELKWS